MICPKCNHPLIQWDEEYLKCLSCEFTFPIKPESCLYPINLHSEQTSHKYYRATGRDESEWLRKSAGVRFKGGAFEGLVSLREFTSPP